MKTLFKVAVFILVIPCTLIITSCGDEEPELINGCTDISAHNYEASADVNDGSCETCDDGIQNGDETGVDCGGGLCESCYGVGLVGEAGGIIFFDKGEYSDGWRYLEAANNDIECGGPNCGVSHEDNRGTSSEVGTGKLNTQILENICPSILPIETIAEGGFSDWFMPSDEELLLLRDQRNLIPNLSLIGGECAAYWSSTLFRSSTGSNKYFLRVMGMDTGDFGFTQPGQLTRPIRQF